MNNGRILKEDSSVGWKESEIYDGQLTLWHDQKQNGTQLVTKGC